MAFSFLKKNGKKVTLLNPKEKRDKYFEEIRTGARLTNDGNAKLDKEGRATMLTKEQEAYRAGYLDAGTDSIKAHKWREKHGKN